MPDGVGDTSEDSIDSTEILSWRMPNLDEQVSATSTSSSAQAHALGRPSRGSIRERLGLGPRLHLHVPTPAEFLSGSSKMPKSRERLSSESTIRAHRPPSRTNSPKLPLQRLTSASLVSFKSIAAITAAGKGIDEEAFCFVRREEALAIDRAFTPEDDPFAADPLTPITPISPVFETQPMKTDKYRSFMSLGNASSTSVSPELPICVLPSWHYRLGSNSNKSSPALTPSSSYHDHPDSTSKRSRLSAVPPGALHKHFPSPVVDGQNLKRALPSIPIDLSRNQLDLNQAVIKVRNYRKLQQEDLNNRRHECEERDSQVVGHSESRPHSPFPLLFQKSKATTEHSARCMPTTQPVGRLVESCRIRHGECIEEPRSLSAKDVDAFGEAARNFTLDYSSREIVSPTAWLLELDDYDDGFKYTLENDAPIGVSNVLALDLHSGTPIHGRYDEGRKLYDRPMNLEGNDYGHSSPLRVFHPAESETDNEGHVSSLHASQCWPLPPNHTVVVDEEYGKVYHAVAPDNQYIRASSTSRSLKYSIHSPEKNLGSAATEIRDYRRSSNSSSHSNELTNSQRRAIVEQCRQPPGYNHGIPAGSPSSYKPPKPVSSHQLKQRSRSTTSLASVGGFSVRTSRTAYYSARSTVSRGSDKSTFTFPRQVGASSREGSIYSASSSRSPDSSGDHGHRPSAVYLDSDSSCVPPCTGSNIGFPVSRDF
ncbi:uncharacterized protein FOMMEDRAFT_19477 [Fomitiporia mediterranea MF3/22]|uniref:uncharacterized protein n=1 Tax=Fomitiporia mediterranea (strain MF3/22) TaxID=694068 RepID=UPI0004409025|nr:uncharacterized protein FOMMEDRAFT_19477 [Fomitiporia mediterranea MF3/22]EJD04223.1 hypothetical protein FOMMEDRAFT_19477 [Fomitiporia mediterranea MF3/22]